MNHSIILNNTPVLIGMENHLCFTTYQQLFSPWKNGWLSANPSDNEPIKFLSGNSGYIFRFPFPDENIPLGEYPQELASRGLLLKIEKRDIIWEDDFEDIDMDITSSTQPLLKATISCDNPNKYAEKIDVELTGQQLLFNGNQYRLCPVLRCPYSQQTFLIKDENKLQLLIGQIIHQYGATAFWKKVVAEFAKGLGIALDLPY